MTRHEALRALPELLSPDQTAALLRLPVQDVAAAVDAGALLTSGGDVLVGPLLMELGLVAEVTS